MMTEQERIGRLKQREEQLDTVLKILNLARLSWFFIIGIGVFVWHSFTLNRNVTHTLNELVEIKVVLKEQSDTIQKNTNILTRHEAKIENLERQR